MGLLRWIGSAGRITTVGMSIEPRRLQGQTLAVGFHPALYRVSGNSPGACGILCNGSVGYGSDILVEMEEVSRIVFRLDLCQPCVVRAEWSSRYARVPARKSQAGSYQRKFP